MATAFIGYIDSQKWYDYLRNFYLFESSFFIPPYVKLYDNLGSIKTQQAIRDDNRHKAGIYCV
jgi:hypothetical protein